VQTSVKRLAYS